MNIRKIIEKITGIDKIKLEIAESLRLAQEAEAAKHAAEEEAARVEKEAKAAIKKAEQNTKDAKEKEAVAKMTPKERATAAKEPWVSVLDVHVNEKNPKNGFFNLDWNEEFIRYLRLNGYQGDSEEEIVDKWFTDLCKVVGGEQGVDMARRGSGNVQRALREDGLSEFS